MRFSTCRLKKSPFKLQINYNCSPLSALVHSYFHSVVKAPPMTSSQPRSRMQIVHPFPFCCQVEFPICHSSAPSFHYAWKKKKRRYNWKVWNGSIVRHCCYIAASVPLSLTLSKRPIFITSGSCTKETCCLFSNSRFEKKTKHIFSM